MKRTLAKRIGVWNPWTKEMPAPPKPTQQIPRDELLDYLGIRQANSEWTISREESPWDLRPIHAPAQTGWTLQSCASDPRWEITSGQGADLWTISAVSPDEDALLSRTWEKMGAMEWTPGSWGKGFQDEAGNLHTWNTRQVGNYRGGTPASALSTAPHHYQMAEQMGMDNWINPVVISPEGWYTTNGYPTQITPEANRFAIEQPGMKYMRDQDRWFNRVSTTVNEWTFLPGDRPNPSFMPRKPLFYDHNTDEVHVGQWGMDHGQMARAIPRGVIDNHEPPHDVSGGWLGYDPQVRGYDESDRPTSYGGWYGTWGSPIPDQVHEAIESFAPSTGYSVGTRAKTAAFQAWKPGVPGRGLVNAAGDVYTWPEDEGTHMDMAAGLGIPHNYDRCFAISPDGKFRMNAWGSEAESLLPTVMQQTGLKPHPYYYPQYRISDNFTNDSREWPDPTAPRASKPPAQKGCTCQWGDKLNCPIHGLNADPENAELDHSWSLPENSPVGYPQDQPRSWTGPYQSSWFPRCSW